MSSDNPRRYIPAPGSVTLSTASGAQLTAWINDAEQVFFDEFNGTATRVYYHFKPGVTGSIQLLNREP
jgi:hypothetical protein